VLVLLLVELVVGDVVAPLLLDLVSSQLVLYKGKIVRVRERLFAAVRI
jgi:hypothetical protein